MAELKELRLKNFKSFRKAVVPFKGGFTAVIGPNGSGKSNILDAILFVLGSTSMKSLRAGRISGLINNTTKESYGKVEITIKDKGNLWKISRTIDKKGKSTCRINDQKKGLNEIVSLLNELGLKSDGDNIVAQGDITKIIEMSPEQRRQVIDNLAGISEFDLKLGEAGKNLEKANDKVKSANLILGERLSRVEELQKEKRAAEEYLKLGETKKRAKATILTLESESAKSKMLENGEKLKKLKLEADALDRKTAELEKKISETEKAQREKEKELFEKQGESFRGTMSKIEALKGEKNLFAEKRHSRKLRLAENSERESILSKRLEALRQENESEKARLSEIKFEKKKAMEALAIAEKKLGLLNDNDKGRKSEIARLERELAAAESGLEEKQAEFSRLLQEKAALERQNSLAEKELNDIGKRLLGLKPAKAEHQELKERLGLLEAKKLQELIESADRNIERALEGEKAFKAEAMQAQSSLKELAREIAQCPVCDSELPALKKKKLAEKRKGEERKALFEAGRLSKELASLRRNREELKKEHSAMHALRNGLAVLAEKVSALKELEERDKALRASVSDASKVNSAAAKAEKELALLKSGRQKLQESLSAIKTDRKTIELNASKSESGHALKRLELEEDTISGKSLKRIEAEKQGAIKETESIHAENSSLGEELAGIEKQSKELSIELEELEKKGEEQSKKLEIEREKKEEIDSRLGKMRGQRDSLGADSKEKSKQMEELRVENGRHEVRLSDLEEESKEFIGVKPLKNLTIKELGKELSEAEKMLEKIGPVNLKAAETLSDEKTELFEVKEKLEKLEEERSAILEMIEKIDVKRTGVFMGCFNKIKENFQRMFYNFFDGSGNLSLTDDENPTESGLLIEAKHKGENLQNIDSMSGGEKTLTALAFIFAIQQFDPAPFYFFDEADAALDESNSTRLTKIVTEISRHSQFVAITHNNTLIRSADQIVGVTVGKEKSSVIGLNLKDKVAEKIAEKNSG